MREPPTFPSAISPERSERRFALAVVLVSTVIFIVLVPLAKVPLASSSAFIPIYQSALVINDLITAVFLFAQFNNIVRSRALLLLACGYLFTAVMAAIHMLTFPGLFSPNGLLGAGPQTTAWLYMFWHGGFPLMVIAYALHHDQGRSAPRAFIDVLWSVGAVLAAAGGLTVAATIGHDALPAIMSGNNYTPAMIFVVSSTWLLSLAALIVLSRRRPESVLDLWLMVVMCAWIFDIALSAVLNAGRFDLGFYAGRIYGLLATSFVLVVLLSGYGRNYARLLKLNERDRRKTAELERLATADALTGIANRRAFEEALDQEWRRTLRHRTPLCLILIDVDFFKRFNDTYGHVAGDQCLRAVAQALAGNARRAGEMAARYGGEEFAVLLPHTDLDDAHRLAQRICEAVRQLGIPHRQSEVASHVTISAGVASALLVLAGELPVEAEHASPTLLVKAADQALYGAKAAGRNQVISTRPGNGDKKTEERRAEERQAAGDELPPDAEPSWGEVVRLPLRRARAPR
jgi:diguanylate cyclase (GGDEF)-like protein